MGWLVKKYPQTLYELQNILMKFKVLFTINCSLSLLSQWFITNTNVIFDPFWWIKFYLKNESLSMDFVFCLKKALFLYINYSSKNATNKIKINKNCW